MRRSLVLILLLLLGGAIVNVAVAWGCARWMSPGSESKIGRDVADELLIQRGFEPMPNDRVTANMGTSVGFTVQQLRLEAWSEPKRKSLWGFIYMAGYPLRSLSAELRGEGFTFAEVSNPRIVGGINAGTPEDWSIPRLLPLRPLWPGFAINTIFYAAILGLLWFGPRSVRRTIRRRRGRCVKCNYDLRGTPADSATCPECGAPICFVKKAGDES